MPGPSAISTTTNSGSARVAMRIVPLPSTASMALVIRLVQTWLSSDGTASICGTSAPYSLDHYAIADPVLEHDERVIEPFGHVDHLHTRPIELRIRLEGVDERRDARCRLLDLGQQCLGRERASATHVSAGSRCCASGAAARSHQSVSTSAAASAGAIRHAPSMPCASSQFVSSSSRSMVSSESATAAVASSSRRMLSSAMNCSAESERSASWVSDASRCRRSRARRRRRALAAAGLFNSWVSPAASVPSDHRLG